MSAEILADIIKKCTRVKQSSIPMSVCLYGHVQLTLSSDFIKIRRKAVERKLVLKGSVVKGCINKSQLYNFILGFNLCPILGGI